VLDDSRGGFFGVNNGSSVTESIHEHCNLRRRDKQGVSRLWVWRWEKILWKLRGGPEYEKSINSSDHDHLIALH
jgi:hypothetical protein